METANLLIVECGPDILMAAIEGDEALAQKLNITVKPNWSEFGTAALQYSLDKLNTGTGEAGWWTYFPVHKKDNRLIGSGGYKGKPGADGTVEIGYEICPDYRRKGFATEMTQALVKHAFSFNEINAVTAHTLAEQNASTKVLEKCGFLKIAEMNDPDDGLLWQWELKRS